MTLTLKDVARDLSLSVVTISKVLRDHPDISDKTKKRVLARLKELNYQPNYAARALITGRTLTMGLIVPDLLHPFFANIAKSMSAEIRRQGYGMLIVSSDEEPEVEQHEIQQFLARSVDVMIIASSQIGTDSFRQIEERKVPYILLDRRFEGLSSNFVGVDDRVVGQLATSHLIEQGCKRIAHIRGPEVSTAVGRLEGYREALAAHKMAPLPGHIVPIGASGDHNGEAGGYEAAQHLLLARKKPDAIFCFNDPVALGAMRAILDAGLRIPEDVAVVGCGNLAYSDFLRVPLTSVDQGSAQIGKIAAAMALKLAQNRVQSGSKIKLIQPSIVVRASSSRAQTKGRRVKNRTAPKP
ncbi:LacI family DNA-binding transcriptional regulator [Terriglobus saanensis]|uniref:Transcriptional regulator, LacI family n=1 Tax=Terriglobus saanensis (strain ATCC BAA-1853 / DSM 23119 / SP1PR4) TaxID=401053 RepID=E8V1V1_TERSS|nr:LacI family DNA-binding transcriptional regulator [Terriglobus saanensis]ADV83439.1 transcriptional regulator, LacI family [Terriglobus saanensis SP1PR4]